MASINDRSSLGDLPAQHFEQYQNTNPNLARQLNLVYAVRFLGYTLDSGIQTDPATRGYVSLGAVWLASHQGRDVPSWNEAMPSRIDNGPIQALKPNAPQGADPYQSNVVGPLAIPAFSQGTINGAPGWADDPGLIPQKVALPLGMSVATNWPGVSLPTTTLTEQQMAFSASGGLCVSVHRGGSGAGKYGSRVYDVDAAGALDPVRWAREQSQRRVYRYPAKGSGIASFPFTQGQASPAAGLAWQCGPDIDGQAGHGVFCDFPSSTGTPTPAGVPTETFGGAQHTLALKGTSLDPAVAPQSFAANQAAFLKNNPGLTQADINKALQIQTTGTGFTSSPTGNHTVSKPAMSGVPQTQSKPQNVPQTTSVGEYAYAVASYRGYGPFDPGGDGCPHQIATTPDGERIFSGHLRETSIIRGKTGDAPLKFDDTAWIETQPDGQFWNEGYIRNDLADDHEWLDGAKKPGKRKIQVASYFFQPTPGENNTTGGRRFPPPVPFDPPPPPWWPGPKPGGPPGPGGPRGGGPPPIAPPPQGEDPGDTSGTGTFIGPDHLIHPFNPPVGADPIPPGGFGFDGTGHPIIPGFSGVALDGGGGGSSPGPGPVTETPPGWGPGGNDQPNPTGGLPPPISTSREVGFPGIIGRPTRIGPGFTDTRYVDGPFPPEDREVLDNTPSAGRFEAFSNQEGYAFQYLTHPGATRYDGGVVDVGGFAVTPPGDDLRTRLMGVELPDDRGTGYITFEKDARCGFGDTGLNGHPADGFYVERYFEDGVTKQWVIIETDETGVAIDGPPAINVDGITETLEVYGHEVMTTDGGNSCPKGYITGFGLSYDAAAPSDVTVEAGLCRDSTNTMDINVDDPSVDYLTNGLLGNDALLQTDTGLLGNSGTGSSGGHTFGTCTLSASIIPFLPARTVTGAIDIAASAGGLAVVTEHSAGTCRFLSEISVGDLIGNGNLSGGVPVGYMMVISIDSDAQCTVIRDFVSSLSVTNVSVSVYENVTVTSGANPSNKITEITRDGLTLYSYDKFNGGSTSAGPLNVVIGQPAAAETLTRYTGAVFYSWIYLWARTKTDGTSTLAWSTQRTTPFTPATMSGYSLWRRVGVLPIHTDNFVPGFSQTDLGSSRLYQYEEPYSGSFDMQVLQAGAAASWTRAPATKAVPPTSRLCLVNATIAAPGGGTSIIYLRPSGIGSSTATRPRFVEAAAATDVGDQIALPLDASQAFDYAGSTPGGTPFLIWVVGYYDKP